MLFVSLRSSAQAGLVDAIEYYYAALDHYFVTAIQSEINALDSGQFPGWVRTGLSFSVYDAGTAVPGVVPVCRFYGSPDAGLDSHFYSASVTECDQVKQKYPGAWIFESGNVFEVFMPDLATGQCPSGSIPIYRAWNKRVDSNHRYTTDLAVEEAMIAKGYVAEGYGTSATPTAMCSPSATTGGGAPVCSPNASDVAPYVGTTITVYAQCSGNPTSYAWSGCTSTSGRCTATASVPGTQTYTVVARNASGASVPASVSVGWQKLPAVPVCSLIVTANSDLPVVNSLALLTAACTGSPSSYNWTGCASGNNLCQVRSPVAGLQTYSVSASNPGGTGAPAYASVNWQASPSAPPGFCGQFPSFLFTDEGWTGTRLISRDFTDDPGFAWNGVWVVKLTVPPGAASTQLGGITVAEFGGPPTTRQTTLSRFPCDFRPNDPGGVNGPLAQSNGNTTAISFRLGAALGGVPGLTPGEVYYVNVRNWQVETGSISCDPAIARCEAFMDVGLPR
jgi:hypothetical protein